MSTFAPMPKTADDDNSCRVLVVGSGIAGTVAAVRAAQVLGRGQDVLLASAGPLFSGSSFFKGTWGLGLIAPDGPDDQEDLAQTIVQVGENAADPQLVRSFVQGIEPAIRTLESWGCELMEPSAQAAGQREYVPCFDRKHRRWRGIRREPFVKAVGNQLRQHQVRVRERWELLDLSAPDLANAGTAVFFDADSGTLRSMAFQAVILCAGGASSLFPRRLTRADCRATVHALAAQAGCRLVNLEFLQFMPGLVSPVQNVVFNEKAFRFMELPSEAVRELGGADAATRLLDQRSTYGPFTCRLESAALDLAVHRAGPQGLPLMPRLADDLPEFARTYFDWLEHDLGVSPDAPLRIAHYAHASNGGVSIDSQGFTGVEGIYAAGESTGGMHGADRIGGLSSANGLTFGLRAGEAAARFAADASQPASASKLLPGWSATSSPCASQVEEDLQAVMDASCGIVRTGGGLSHGLRQVAALQDQLAATRQPAACPADAALTRRTQLRLETARLMLDAALTRAESLGSHYRADDPRGISPTV